MMRIARVFPRRTNATPDDELSFVGPPGLFVPPLGEVHISVTFSWDIPAADLLAKQWAHIAPVKVGGPALGERGGDFEPGRYLKPGYVITSRGCRNRCWFCDVWKREGDTRELPIRDGWNLLDDNLLACSRGHVDAVFEMLSRQHDRIHLTGGLEAALLESWHVEALRALRPKQMFFAYDTPDDLEPLRNAGAMLHQAGWTHNTLRAYVLIGYPADTMEHAVERLHQTLTAGFMPMAMRWRGRDGSVLGDDWAKLQREWARPAAMRSKINELSKAV